MGRLLRLRDYVLISASVVGDLLDETRLAGGMFPKALKNQYGYVPEKYKRQSYLSTVSNMLSAGDIVRKTDDKGKAYLELTSKGVKKYKREFSLQRMSTKKWDGWFMFVSFDIEEKNRKARDHLRSKLKELGFGQLQKSVWISPYHFESDMWDYVKQMRLSGSVHIFTGKSIYSSDVRTLAWEVWDLKEINNKYKKLIDKCSGLNKEGKRYSKNKKSLMDEYLDILSKDPFLPKELTGNRWLKVKAIRVLNKLEK